jgi:hypothetical protein
MKNARPYKNCQSCGMPMRRDEKAAAPMPTVQRTSCTAPIATKQAASSCRTSRRKKCNGE